MYRSYSCMQLQQSSTNLCSSAAYVMYCNTGVQDYSYSMDSSMRVPVALAQQHTYSIAAQLHSCSIGGAAE